MICPTLSRVVAEPSPLLVTWEYRLCYFLITLTGGPFLVFCLAFLKGGHPGRRWLRFLFPLIAALSLVNLTPWTIAEATCVGGVYRQANGPLHPLFIATVSVMGAAFLWLIHLKRRRSLGTDRARATYILIGFGIFIPLAVVLAAVLPALMSPDVTTDWSYPLTLIPIGFTAYAILRHRLLDVRLAIRQTLSYLLTLALFGAPLVAIYALTSTRWRNDAELNPVISVSTLIIAVAFTPIALRFTPASPRDFSSPVSTTRWSYYTRRPSPSRRERTYGTGW